jgi:hypothetical protein
MNPFEMVVLIVLIVTIGQVIRVKVQNRGKHANLANDPEAARLRDEVKTLKERVIVLERIATDKNNLLEQEFERLRDR